jgi:hypothetical protein
LDDQGAPVLETVRLGRERLRGHGVFVVVVALAGAFRLVMMLGYRGASR